MSISWKRLFRPVILERGEDIYLFGEIDHINKTETGYSAVVHGTDDYDVTVITDGETVKDMECTCPYAEDGNNCKHMAALLFAAENGDFTEEPEEDGETMEEILDSMSEEQIRSELYTIMKEDDRYRGRIMARYRKTPADRNDIRRICGRLENLAYEVGDRSGFVDWRHGFEYVSAFTGCLSDQLEPMLVRGEYMPAFEILKEAFNILNQVDMDGSGGEHTEIAAVLEEYWDRVIHLASEEDREKMHSWFINMKKVSDSMICGDSIDAVLDNSFDDLKYLQPMLEELKEELKHNESSGWQLKRLLEKYRNLLVRIGGDLQEYEAWLNEHADLTTVREIRLEEARTRNDLETQIAIMEDLYRSEDDRFGRFKRLLDLLEAYEKKNDTGHIKTVLTLLLTEHRSGDMDYVHRLRPMCTQEEWEPLREQILQNNPGMSLEILHEEKLYDRLLQTLADYPAETVERYRPELQDLYPRELLEMYLLHLRKLSERHGSRPVYEEMRKYLYAAAEIPGGRQPVRNLVRDWMSRFTSRRVMMEIMQEILAEI